MDCGTVLNAVPVPTKVDEENDDDDRSPPGMLPLVLRTAAEAEDISDDEEEIVVDDVPSDDDNDLHAIPVEVATEGHVNTMRTYPKGNNANFLNGRYSYPEEEAVIHICHQGDGYGSQKIEQGFVNMASQLDHTMNECPPLDSCSEKELGYHIMGVVLALSGRVLNCLGKRIKRLRQKN